MKTKQHNSRILKEMYETACGLHNAGLMSEPTMLEISALNRYAITDIYPHKIKTLRKQNCLSQAGLAVAIKESLDKPNSKGTPE